MRKLHLTRLTVALGLTVLGLACALVTPPARAAEKTTLHPLGLSFRHPDDWQVGPAGGLMQLVPNDRATDVDGPLEVYFLQVARLPPDVTRADDSRVVAALDEQWESQAPFLKRSGEPLIMATGIGPGAALTWEGTGEMGVNVRAHAFTAVSRGFLFQLLGVGLKENVATREETLRSIFASFAAAEPQHDPALAALWRFETTDSLVSGNFTAATLHRIELRLGSDGSGLLTETTRLVGDPGDTGEKSEAFPLQWFGSDGTLCLILEDGSFASLQYELQSGEGSRALTVRSEGARPRTYTEIR